MFARSVFRPARTAASHVRRYASEAAAKSSSNTLLFTGAAAGAGIGGYMYSQRASAEGQHGNTNESGAFGQPASKTEEANIPGKAADASKCFTGGDQGFVSLVLMESENINHNTKKLRFHLPEENSVSGLTIACMFTLSHTASFTTDKLPAALITKYKGPEMEKPVIRPYTPVSDENTVGYLDFIVKKYPGGPMSEHLHNMQPGQRLDMKGPIPKYPWEENKHDHIALIAGGTGITPMYQLARAIFNNPNDKTKVTLVFGNVSEEDVLLKREWEDLENKYPNRMRAFYTLNNPPEDWPGPKGMITTDLLKTVLPDPKKENIKVFVCGPPGMYKAIAGAKKSPKDQGELTGMLAELGYNKDQVYKF
ncbi:ferredoxin reductase-like protein [Aureobasidium pullulans]|nr:ferredoxin reductase-like protein [Aureobasidium pullulans]